MMLDQQNAAVPERSRVSIAERLVPSISFGFAALSGAVGAVMTQFIYAQMRENQNAGFDAFFIAMAQIHASVGGLLAFSALFGVIGIGVSAARMFAAAKKSSPPGWLYLFPAFLSLIPPLAVGYAGWLAITAVNTPNGGIGRVAGTIDVLCWIALAAAVISLLALAAFSFIPFTSRTGRKYTPVIFLVLVEAAIVCLSAAFFLVTRMCMSLTSASFF